MKKYNIYGIGAALVDTEVEVSDEFLANASIDKGVMTLVDEARQTELIGSLSAQDSAMLRKCGGSVCNSVVAASSLGAQAFFSGKVADDEDGQLYIDDLKEAGVDFHSAGQEPGITGKCLVMVTDDAERTMNTFLGASEGLSAREIDQAALVDSDGSMLRATWSPMKLEQRLLKRRSSLLSPVVLRLRSVCQTPLWCQSLAMHSDR